MPLVTYDFKMPKTDLEALSEFAKSFPERLQKRVFKLAGKKAAAALANRLHDVFPLGTKPHGFKGGPPGHLRDTVAYSKARNYKSGTTLFVVGYRSGANNLQTLFERGNFLTSPRMTAHESNSTRVRVVGQTIRKRRIVKTESGRVRTVYENVPTSSRRSTGSAPTGRQGPYRGVGGLFVRGGHAHSTGDFPKTKRPFAPITRTYREMRGIVNQILTSEIKAGFKRAIAP